MFPKFTARSFCLLVIAILLAVPTTASADESNGATANQPRPAWAELMPPQTMFAIRVDAEEFDAWWEQIQAGIERVGSQRGGPLPDFPARHRPSALALSLVVGEFDDIFEGDEPRLERTQLEHLNDGRPMFLAMSAYGYGGFVEAARAGVLPATDAGLSQAGRSVPMRVLLASKAPKKLAAEIDAFCQTEMDCENLVRLHPTDAYLVVDLMGTSADAKKTAEDTGWADPQPMFDRDYLTRQTPAALQFMHRTTGVSLYTRPDGLFTLGALSVGASRYYRYRNRLDGKRKQAARSDGSSDADIDLEYTKRRMYRGLQESMAFRKLLSPESREVEDLVFRTGATGADVETSGVRVDILQSFTERGRAVARAGARKTTLPTLQMRRPAVQMAWNYDLNGALEAAAVPEWMKRTPGQGRQRLSALGEVIEEVEIVGAWFLAAAHPFGVLKGALQSVDEMQLPVSGSDIAGVVAGRLWLDGRPPSQKQAQAPLKVFGGLSLAATPDSKALSSLRAALEMAGMAMQTPVFVDAGEMTTEDNQTLQTMQIKLDRSGNFEETTAGQAASQPLSADIDFDRILARLEPMTISSFDLDDEPTEMMRFFRSLSVRTAEGDHGRVFRMHFGPGEVATPAKPADHPTSPADRLAGLEKPTAIPACADSAFRAAYGFVKGQLGDGEVWGRRGYRRAAREAKAASDNDSDSTKKQQKKRAEKAERRLAEVQEAHSALVDELEAAAKACEDAPQPWRDRVERAVEAWSTWKPTRETIPMPDIYQ